MKTTTSLAALLFVAVLVAPLSAGALPPVQEDTLRQYVAELQRNPDDANLRERIIKHVRTMKTPPAIPEEARRYFIEGNVLVKAAKDEKGYELAIATYRQCLLVAPWWPDANYNFAIALELANRLESAVNALKLYIATNPGEAETRKAQDKIYEIGAKIKLAQRDREEEASAQAAAAKKQDEYEAWLQSLDGARFVGAATPWGAIGHENEPTYAVRYIVGREVHWGRFYGEPASFVKSPITQMEFSDGKWSQPITGKQYKIPVPTFMNDQRPCVGTISDDGQFITEKCPTARMPDVYTRVK